MRRGPFAFGITLAILAAVGCASAPTDEPVHLRRPISAWAKDLRDTEFPEVRLGALRAVRALGQEAKGVVPTLIDALGGTDPATRVAAAEALAAIGPHARAAGPQLLALLDSDADWHVRRAVALALGRVDMPTAIDPLVATLVGDPERWVREAAGNALGTIGEPACVAVMNVLEHAVDLPTRNAAARALGRMGSGGVGALPLLVDTLYERWVGRRAARALGEMGPAAEAAIPALRDLVLSDAEVWARRRGAEALGKIGPASIPALIQLVHVDDEFIRLHVCKALGSMEEDAEPAARVLAGLLADPRPRVRSTASRALEAMGEVAVPALVRTILSKNEDARHLALDTLGRLGPDAVTAVPALAKVIDYRAPTDVFTRQRAVAAVGRIGPAADQAVVALSSLAEQEWPHSGWLIRAEIADALAKLERTASSAEPALERLLYDDRAQVRAAASAALRAIGSDLGEQPDPYAEVDLFGDIFDEDDEELPGLEPESEPEPEEEGTSEEGTSEEGAGSGDRVRRARRVS